MARIHVPLLLCVAFLASPSAFAAGVPDHSGSSTIVSGVYSVTFNLSIASALPAGTTITCRAQILPNQGPPNLMSPQPASLPSGAAGRVVLMGSTASCATEIPFSWTLTGAEGGVVLSYQIDAVSNSGSAPLLVRSSAGQNIAAALPAAGRNASLSLNLAF